MAKIGLHQIQFQLPHTLSRLGR